MRRLLLIYFVFTVTVSAQLIPFDYKMSGERLSKISDKTPVSNTVERILINGSDVWFGTSKGLTKTSDNGNSFTNYYGTDEFDKEHISALGFKNSIIWAATWNFKDEVGGTSVPTGSGLRYSDNGGETWIVIPQSVDNPGDSSITYGINKLRALPITVPQQNFTYDLDFTDDAIWTVNFAGGLRKSTNKGLTWQRVLLPPDNLNSIKPTDTLKFALQPKAGKFGPEDYLNHRAFSILVEDNNTVWVGTAGGINKSIDGGISWQKFNHTNQSKSISGNYVLAIEKNEYDNSIWAATWKAEGAAEEWGVSRTTDGGLTWDTFLLGERALDFAFKYYGTKGNYTGSEVIAATKNGAFRTTNNGASWIAAPNIADDLTRIKIESKDFLAAEANKLINGSTNIWLGTNGGLSLLNETNGFWSGSWKVFLASGQTATAGETFAFPNPFSPNSGVITIKYSVSQSADVTIRIFDFGMNLVKTVIQNAFRASSDEQLDIWNGRDESGNIVPNGVYFYRIDIGSEEPLFGKIMVLM